MSDQELRPHIAFIGLGNMGLPMALNLLKAGHEVTGVDLSSKACDCFTQNGGAIAALAEAVADADIIITMLPTSAIVLECWLGSGGALSRAKRGSLAIDMSSSRPADTRTLGAALAAKGVDFVDAPVSGGVSKARDGTLAIMVGGSAFARAEPVLRAMGSKIFHAGPLGAGHAVKVLNNYVSACGALATMEALIVAREFGLDQACVNQIINASTGRNNTTDVKVDRFVLSNSYDSGFDISLMSKDVSIAKGMADDLNLSLPGLSMTDLAWRDATTRLGTKADHTEIYRYIDLLAKAPQ